ncbi:RNA polymerase sigma factor [Ralstonia pickettii]|uniref:RNA polymerase sigma factor n=1 Tax=Ralstonia pickettii TaxID=329 RepID=UPI00046868D2|nr:sigma factor [Ralstonia pickettii]
MIRDDLENQELTHLLRKFGDTGANGRVAERAQREFYHRVYKTIDLCALQTAKFNHEIAVVAVQETWLQILNSAHKYDPERSSVKTWVQRITQYCTLTELRKHYKEVRIRDALRTGGGPTEADDAPHADDDSHGNPLDGLTCPVPPRDDVGDAVYQQQVVAVAQACLETLPAGRSPNYRLAMELALDESLTYEAMKTVLQAHMPEGELLNSERVRGWVREAANRMRACLGRKLGMGKGTSKEKTK